MCVTIMSLLTLFPPRADELKRKNAELEREILEFKFSPLSTGGSRGSSEWRWPQGNETKHRSSATSSDGGITSSRTGIGLAWACTCSKLPRIAQIELTFFMTIHDEHT